MPSVFTKEHIRVSKPVTTDGMNLAYKDGKKIFKVTYLPKSALKAITALSNRLPEHLRFKIEVVPGDVADVKPDKKAKVKEPA